MQDSLYSTLKFSYDNLSEETTIRECFLCCSLWPEDCKILKEDLIMTWMGLGLIDPFDDITQALEMGHSFIGLLLEACLLDPVANSDDHVIMHDVIRDLALWIVSDSGEQRNRWVVKAGVMLREVSGKLQERWREAERVSLMRNQIEELPQQSSRCLNLSTLILNRTMFTTIPQGFFRCMSALRYLHLSDTGIGDIPYEIGSLVELEYLNLSHTRISFLPAQLAKLVNLKYLLLVFTPLETIPGRLLSRLPKLQVLDLFPMGGALMFEELKFLEGGVLKALGIKVTSLRTLQRLSGLPVWHLNINGLRDSTSAQLQLLSIISMWRGLQELKISSCSNLEELVMDSDHNTNPASSNYLRRLERLHLYVLYRLKEIIWRDVVPGDCLQRLKQLEIDWCHSLRDVTWVLHLPCLTSLRLESCGALEQVVAEDVEDHGRHATSYPTFPRLQILALLGLPRLRSIIGHALDFSSLQKLFVLDCPELKKLPFKAQIANEKLRRINGTKEWWDSIVWEEDSIQTSLLPFFIEVLRG